METIVFNSHDQIKDNDTWIDTLESTLNDLKEVVNNHIKDNETQFDNIQTNLDKLQKLIDIQDTQIEEKDL